MVTCTDTTDGLLVTATVPVADRYGWTTLVVMVRKHPSHTVNTEAGAVTTVHILMMSPSDALQVVMQTVCLQFKTL